MRVPVRRTPEADDDATTWPWGYAPSIEEAAKLMPDLKAPLTNPNAARAPRISIILEERHPDPNDDSFEVTWQVVRFEWFSASSTTPARSATLIQRIEGRVQGDFYTKDIYRVASSTEREKIQALIESMEGSGQVVATELPELIYSEVNR